MLFRPDTISARRLQDAGARVLLTQQALLRVPAIEAPGVALVVLDAPAVLEELGALSTAGGHWHRHALASDGSAHDAPGPGLEFSQ